MTENFHLIDLVSQGAVVQRLLRGKSASEKLAWLSARGTVSQMEKKEVTWPDTYYFVSTTGAKCAFVLQDDRFRFAGDHHFVTAPDDDDSEEANPEGSVERSRHRTLDEQARHE